jgi:MFS family permease
MPPRVEEFFFPSSHVLRREIKELYVSVALAAFAMSMIKLFEPVYLYRLGWPLAGIALFFAAGLFLYLLLLPLGAHWAARWGFEHMILLSRPLFALYFSLLYLIPYWFPAAFLAPLAMAACKASFWPAYHANFARYGSARFRGIEISFAWFLITTFAIFGPALGGVIAAHLGFGVLFAVASALMLLSALPLFTTRERFKPGSFRYGEVWRMLFNPRLRREAFAFCGYGSHSVHGTFWPLYLFMAVGGLTALGIVRSLAIFIAALAAFGVGRFADIFSYRRLIRWATPVWAFSLLLRPLALTLPLALSFDVFSRVALAGVQVPLRSVIYNRGRKLGHLRYNVFAELLLILSKLNVFLLAAAIFWFFEEQLAFLLLFILAAVVSLSYLAFPFATSRARR